MTQNPNNPEKFEAWCDSLSAEEQAAYLASIQITAGPMAYNPVDSVGGYIAGEIPAEQLEKMRQQRPEFFVTDRDMTDRLDEAYVQALIDRYGDVAELVTNVEDDTDAPDYSEIDPDFYDDYHPE